MLFSNLQVNVNLLGRKDAQCTKERVCVFEAHHTYGHIPAVVMPVLHVLFPKISPIEIASYRPRTLFPT